MPGEVGEVGKRIGVYISTLVTVLDHVRIEVDVAVKKARWTFVSKASADQSIAEISNSPK